MRLAPDLDNPPQLSVRLNPPATKASTTTRTRRAAARFLPQGFDARFVVGIGLNKPGMAETAIRRSPKKNRREGKRFKGGQRVPSFEAEAVRPAGVSELPEAQGSCQV